MTAILDHGYLKLIETWGSDERIIEAARMSTDGGFVSWDPYPGHPRGDQGLLEYLYRNAHHTPFEMAGMVIEVQAPIMVFREWHRHRTQSYNEMSARYIPLPDVNYLPSTERLMQGAAGNKQAAGVAGAVLTVESAVRFRASLEEAYAAAELEYQDALAAGVPKELARLVIPVGRYSRMRASANLRNWLAFLTLRMDEKAQWEIRQYANAVGDLIRTFFPRTWDLFVDRFVRAGHAVPPIPAARTFRLPRMESD